MTSPRTVSRETLARLETYAQLLTKWNVSINLIADSTREDVWTRHIEDSLQLLDHVPTDACSLVDLGSGGGFPGLVIAIAAAEVFPGLSVSLVESDQRKSAFLRTVSRETGVPVKVHSKRIEELPTLAADVVSARALAPLPRLIPLARMHMTPTGRAIFLKGRQAEEEITQARKSYDFSLDLFPSLTDPEAAVLVLESIRDV